jgi:hypothetical protein
VAVAGDAPCRAGAVVLVPEFANDFARLAITAQCETEKGDLGAVGVDLAHHGFRAVRAQSQLRLAVVADFQRVACACVGRAVKTDCLCCGGLAAFAHFEHYAQLDRFVMRSAYLPGGCAISRRVAAGQ